MVVTVTAAYALVDAVLAVPEPIVRRNKARDGDQWEVVEDLGGPLSNDSLRVVSLHVDQASADDYAGIYLRERRARALIAALVAVRDG